MRYIIEGLVIALAVIFVLTRTGSKHDCFGHLERASSNIETIAKQLEETRDVNQTVLLLRVQSHYLATLSESPAIKP